MGGFEGSVYVSVDQYLSIHRPFICRSIGRPWREDRETEGGAAPAALALM
jgi:hypothetical protein